MTNEGINEIYALAYEALHNGQSFFRVHIFPFKITNKNIEDSKNHKWYLFWTNLKEGYEIFEQTHIPPNVEVKNRKYMFSVSIGDG